jgi:minor histocompatibility antigen H13
MQASRISGNLNSLHVPSLVASNSRIRALRPLRSQGISAQPRGLGLWCRAVDGASEIADPIPKPAATIWRWEDSSDAVKTYGVFLGVLAAGTLPALQGSKLGDLPYFISLAICTIYIGAHRGLNFKQRQQINLREGVLAPFAASAALGGIYLLFKYFPELSLQGFFDIYFWLIGAIATIGAFSGPARKVGSKLELPVWTVSLPEWIGAVDDEEKPLESTDLYATDLFVAVAGIALASADLAAHHGNFTLSNAIACLVAADILQLVGVSSFRVAGVLLCGLLAYDVFWVFGSPAAFGDNVMLKVATSDALVSPTRLIFPRLPGSVGEASTFPFSLLGLGDIAVPGLLACLALRYDASRAIDMKARGVAAASAIQDAIDSLDATATGDEIAYATGDAAIAAYERIADLELEQRNRTMGASESGSTETVYNVSDAVLYQRHYFVPVMAAYVVGLGIAFGVNAVTKLGQPALLYLVPCTLGAVAAVAASRKDLDKVWNYTDTTKVLGEKIKESSKK